MRILTIFSALAVILLAGCATPKRVATLEGRGTKQVYNTGFDQTWRAAVDAAQANDLEIINSDRSRGYIGARRTIRVHTFGENVGIWVREIAPAQTEVEVVSRQAGPPVASWRNWENEIQRAIAANLTREAVGTAPRSTVIERGSSPTIVVPENRETIVVPESRSRETIVVPETRTPTVVVPETSRTREALREEQRRLDDLRTRRDAGERALANEVDATKRDMLQREIDRLREDQRLQQKRLEDLEQQLK
jgi:hypothetical protein